MAYSIDQVAGLLSFSTRCVRFLIDRYNEADERRKHPGAKIEIWATDEHRIGLKSITRGVWAPIGERPVALGHHRFEWLYVTALSSPPPAVPSGTKRHQ